MSTQATEKTGLQFDTLGGPLVVVCGLHGGAGTSTLAHSIAHQAARESPTPVLLCETQGSVGDQAALAGVSPLYAPDSAPVAVGRPAVASAWWYAAEWERGHGRTGLMVVDAGTWRSTSARGWLENATHVLWLTLARPGAAERARSILSDAPATGKQALIARAHGSVSRTDLRALAEQSVDELILTANGIDDDKMMLALTAIAGFLRSDVL